MTAPRCDKCGKFIKQEDLYILCVPFNPSAYSGPSEYLYHTKCCPTVKKCDTLESQSNNSEKGF